MVREGVAEFLKAKLEERTGAVGLWEQVADGLKTDKECWSDWCQDLEARIGFAAAHTGLAHFRQRFSDWGRVVDPGPPIVKRLCCDLDWQGNPIIPQGVVDITSDVMPRWYAERGRGRRYEGNTNVIQLADLAVNWFELDESIGFSAVDHMWLFQKPPERMNRVCVLLHEEYVPGLLEVLGQTEITDETIFDIGSLL